MDRYFEHLQLRGIFKSFPMFPVVVFHQPTLKASIVLSGILAMEKLAIIIMVRMEREHLSIRFGL